MIRRTKPVRFIHRQSINEPGAFFAKLAFASSAQTLPCRLSTPLSATSQATPRSRSGRIHRRDAATHRLHLAATPRPCGAGQGVKLTWREFDDEVTRLAAGLLALGLEPGDRIGIWSPPTVPNGCWCSSPPPRAGRSWSTTSTPPIAAPRTRVRAERRWNAGAGPGPASTRLLASHYLGMLRELARLELGASAPGAKLRAAKLPALRHVIVASGDEHAPGLPAFRRHRARPTAIRSPPALSHAVQARSRPARCRSTSSTRPAPPAGRRARRSRTATSCNNALVHRPSAPFHGKRPRCASRCRSTIASAWCSATLCCVHARRGCIVVPGEAVRLAGHAPDGPCGTLHRAATACRPCSSPPRTAARFDQFDLSTPRTGIMAGAPCPVELMKRVVDQDARARKSPSAAA